MVADLEAHLANLPDLFLGHEALTVIHPAVCNEKRRAESRIGEIRGDRAAMRPEGIVEGQSRSGR